MSELLKLSEATKSIGRLGNAAKQSGLEPVGVVTARIVGKLMARLQKDAA